MLLQKTGMFNGSRKCRRCVTDTMQQITVILVKQVLRRKSDTAHEAENGSCAMMYATMV